MTWLSLREVAAMTDGELVGEDVPIDSVSTDTRRLARGQLFIALKGPRFDAHDFVGTGQADVAAGLLVARRLETACPQVLVDDTEAALSRLSSAWRERLTLPVVGLTGSNGKTTVKEMIAAILATKSNVYATQGNLNNQIGVPLTLLAIRSTHEYAVVEMGANHPGEIAALTRLVRPHVALITNAGPAHLEGFGSLEGVASAKGEIYEGLSADGTGIVNADDPFAGFWRGLVGARRCLTFGLDQPADVAGRWEPGKPLEVSTPQGIVDIQLPLEGRHNALNALAATASALALGVSLDSIRAGLESMRPVQGRLVSQPAINGARILDDTYNANPASYRAAVEVLVSRPGIPWLVLGDMGELGGAGRDLHFKAGELARETGVDRLYTFGPLSRAAAEAFGSRGRAYRDLDRLIEDLAADLHQGVTVLVKGSRAMHMERVVHAIRAGEGGLENHRGA